MRFSVIGGLLLFSCFSLQAVALSEDKSNYNGNINISPKTIQEWQIQDENLHVKPSWATSLAVEQSNRGKTISATARGHEGSGGGHFTRSKFFEIGYEAIDLIRGSKIANVGGYKIDWLKLEQLIDEAVVEIVNEPIVGQGINSAFAYEGKIVQIYSKDFNNKSTSDIRQIVIHEILRLARIPDDRNFISIKLNQFCDEYSAQIEYLRSEVRNGRCSHSQPYYSCFSRKTKRIQNWGDGITMCERASVSCGGIPTIAIHSSAVIINLMPGEFYAGACYGTVVVCTEK